MRRIGILIGVLISALPIAILSFGEVRAYYGSSYTYYLADNDLDDYVHLTSSGQWSGWNGAYILTTLPRIDANIMSVGYEFRCWRLEIVGTTSSNVAWDESSPFLPPPQGPGTTLNYGNTPWAHGEIAGSVPVGAGNGARWTAGLGNDSGIICNPPYGLAALAYNSFIVPYGTNYNNQGPAAWPYR